MMATGEGMWKTWVGFIFSCVRLRRLQLLAINCPCANRPMMQNNLRRLKAGKREENYCRSMCVLGVKSTCSHRAGTNQGPVLGCGCCSAAVVLTAQWSMIFQLWIEGFTYAVWMLLAPWNNCKYLPLENFWGNARSWLGEQWLISEEWLKII